VTNRSFGPALVLGLVLACTTAACGGGGGGGGGPTVPPPPARMISWSPDAEPGDDVIYLDVRDLSNPDAFVLEIRARRVSDLYGVALDLVYPSNMMTFDADAVSEGDFFSKGGFDTLLEISERDRGRIVIGLSRVGAVRGRSSSGLLLSLPFATTANGASELAIESQHGYDSDGVPMSLTWLGGTVRVQR
jgi:hypothetical protein